MKKSEHKGYEKFSDAVNEIKGGIVGLFAIIGAFVAISIGLMFLAYFEGTMEEIVMTFVNNMFKGLFK